jgi:hypothetical protein
MRGSPKNARNRRTPHRLSTVEELFPEIVKSASIRMTTFLPVARSRRSNAKNRSLIKRSHSMPWHCSPDCFGMARSRITADL